MADRYWLARVAGVFLAVALPGAALAQGPGGKMPPPGVTVETVKPITVPITYDYAGRVVASREVEVRARVGGILLQRAFDEGARVKKGDLLFKIDPASYQAQVALARANVLEAKAELDQSTRAQDRVSALAKKGASSQASLDDANSNHELAQARLEAAQAQLQTAGLSLDYATVQAPVGGITSLEQVPEGSLLSTGDLLTKITQLDPIYVNFSAADTEAASIRQLLDSGKLTGDSKTSIKNDLKVQVTFGDGTTYNQTGTIDFTSTTINSQTGTILSRAVLPNPDSQLLPGQFVRLKLTGLKVRDAITLPTEALMQGPQGTFVYTLDKDNVASVTPVTVERQLPNEILLSGGLKGGERVVVKGVIKVRPGQPVDPVASEDANANDKGANDKGPVAPSAAAEPSKTGGAEAGAGMGAKTGDQGGKDGQAANADKRTDGATGTVREAANASAGEDEPFVAYAGDGPVTPENEDGPPVPLSALPDGASARDATRGVSERAELAR